MSILNAGLKGFPADMAKSFGQNRPSKPLKSHEARGAMSETDVQLRWALCALELVANGLENRRGLESTDVELINLEAAKDSIESALRLICAPAAQPKFCTWCQKDNHNDSECWSTRPADWGPSQPVVWGDPRQDYPGGPIYRVGTSTGVNAPSQTDPKDKP